MIVDVSSVCWTSLLAGEDAEHGYEVEHEGNKVKVNSAAFGFENALTYLVAAMKRFNLVPHQMIFVIEGESSKLLRKSFLPQYKEDRDSRPPQAYDEFNRLKEILAQAFLAVGSQVVKQDGIEADDVIAYLAQELDGERIILSTDKDLCVLLQDPNVKQYRSGNVVTENPWGPFDYKYITLYKALVGGKDNVPGAKGYGPKAFLDTLCIFGADALASFEDMIVQKKIPELAEDVAEQKALQKVIDSADLVYASYAASKLYPEKINTMRKPLQWRAGMVQPLTAETDERLKPWAGRVRLIHKGNFDEAVKWMQPYLDQSPFVSLDIETSTCDESDDWLASIKKKSTDDDKLGVDVFGSELTSLGLTFGDNLQYTFYFTVDHKETGDIRNVSKWDVLKVMKMIPDTVETIIQNDSFELPILYMAWKDDAEWQNNGWHGFLPNVRDTIDASSYVDENQPSGLKQNSQRLLGYQQQTYDEVTTMEGPVGTLTGGRVVSEFVKSVHALDNGGDEITKLVKRQAYDDMQMPIDGVFEDVVETVMVDQPWEKRSYRMNELTAEHVLHYGSDDPICTAALYNYFRVIMEIEKTWEVFREVEQKPAYLAALGFVQGTPFSLERLKELEKEDDKEHAEAWAKVRDFLIAKGWEGTVCPVYTEITPAAIKEAVKIVTGLELKTAVRTVSKFPALIRQFADEATTVEGADYKIMSHLEFIAQAVEKGDLGSLNELVSNYFSGEPDINFDSPKQMQNLLYYVLDLPVRIVNKLTPKERTDKPALAKAVQKFNKIAQGSAKVEPLTPEEKELLKLKAATDDTAVDFALAYDCPVGSESRATLEAMTAVKKIETRRKLYYRPYPLLRHWKDGRLHPSLNQNRAVTRRYSDSGPNRQQLPKKGEGVKVREGVVPHRKDAVIVSIDFSGQELRLMAGQSRDENMLACYIGEKLKDIHSITASGAMPKKWGKEEVKRLADELKMDHEGAEALYELFLKLRKHEDKSIAKKADDLRKDGKNVNFATQFDAQALKVSHMTIMSVEDAQAFIDAKHAMFPKVETWKEEVRDFIMKTGYVTTMMGARRHLRDSIMSDDKWIAEKAGRQGPNFKIQGSAAEMTKMSMKRFWESNAMFKFDAVFIAPVHDELVASVRIDHAVEFIRKMHSCMTQPYADLCVPVMGSISLGTSFGHQIECGDWFIQENIEAALERCKTLYKLSDKLGIAPWHLASWDTKYPIRENGVQVGFTSPAANEPVLYAAAA